MSRKNRGCLLSPDVPFPQAGSHRARKNRRGFAAVSGVVEAPPNAHQANQYFIETGAWQYKHLRQRRIIEFHPWTPLEALTPADKASRTVKGSKIERAREFQAMLDAGVVRNRAELARRLGLSRARITQIMNLLKEKP